MKEITSVDLGLEGDESSLFINELIAFQRKKPLYKLKQKCREVGYHHIITNNGITKMIKKNKESCTFF